ncbi:thymidine kinase [Reinekea marinisedimentorum]|uniref:Thymidine kinase n=1 Tax=Reinekea marinisedimentorum TaxID=230495 RepID=A0A4R3I8C0_9GAMM|nr:thymidine kinase [Reinekea marinisedimentorum]TCS42503.1 thymidine kinase [Reinekea marinisedimentorum]
MAQLYFYYSAMNAGKSTALLQSDYNYHERGMKTRLLTARLDNRFGDGRIASRIGLEKPADTFVESTDLIEWYQQLPEVDCILIDEAQFLTRKQVDDLAMIVDRFDTPVLCYGIRTDFQGELFPGSERLLAISDKLTELKTICHCGRKAIMVVRMDEHGNALAEGAQVQIGGNERYVSMCRKHYYEALGLITREN